MTSRITDVELPVREVTLKKMRARGGEPLVVRAEAVAEDRIDRVTNTLRLAEAAKRFPGGVPEDPRAKSSKPENEAVSEMLTYAEPIIEAGCYLMDPDGRYVPAFCFCGEHPERIPGRLLGVEDKAALFHAVMEVGSYLGGAAEAARFPDDQEGQAAGAGTVDAGSGDGDAAGGPVGGPGAPLD